MLIKQISSYKYHFILAFVFFVAGILANKAYGDKSAVNYLKSFKPIRENSSEYKFTKPLLAYDSAESSKEFSEYQPLEQSIQKFINGKKLSGDLDNASVYYRNLNEGRWVGINENDNYNPASLFKVPLMIAYLKLAENNPEILNKNLTYTKDISDSTENIPYESPTKLKVNSSYSVEQLLQAMIIDSDNGAKDILLNNIDRNDLSEIYTDLGIADPDNSSNYLISPKIYSLFFRILYNSTYLDPKYSELALSWLNQATYKDGLAAGIPDNINISHKFGEHVEVSKDNNSINLIELHDCGIIYKSQNPYLLCVMTKSTQDNIKGLEIAIGQISKLVYDQIN